MNKAELIAKLADDAGITKTQANASLDSFSVSKRAARNGRNPQTGEVIKIKARKVAKFKAGKELAGKL